MTSRAAPGAELYKGPLPHLDPEADLPDPPGRFVRVRGRRSVLVRRMADQVRRDGAAGAPVTGVRPEPALYVHGLFSDSTYWVELDHFLSGRLAGEALDLPGFGGSDAAPRQLHSLDDFVDVVIGYLEQSGQRPVHLAGNSLGGVITLVVAARRPELVRTLTLMSPAMPFQVARPQTLAFGAAPLLPFLSPESQVDSGGEHVFGDVSRLTAARRRRMVEVFERQKALRTRSASVQSMASLARTYLHRGEGSLWKLAGRVRAPTLVVWGARDSIVPPSLAPRLSRTVPDARLLMLDDVGHLPYVEAPETVARAMLALVDE